MLSYCAGCGENYDWRDHGRHRMCSANTVKSATNIGSCNHCVTKDAEIARLRNQVAELSPSLLDKPKRDRAEYMRNYRKTCPAPTK